MNKSKIILLIFGLLIFTDIVYSFLQHASKPLDGDLPGGIVPAADVHPVLHDPLGISAISEGKMYPNPNRYFSHASFYYYFNSMPFILQSFVDPISSIYYSSALFKTAVQVLLIFLIASIISGKINSGLSFVILSFVICQFFQTNGFQSEIGIIDSSITYTFFYAYPMVYFLLYFLPLFRFYLHRENFSSSARMNFWRILLAFPLCLSGPLNPGLVLIVSLLCICKYVFDKKAFQKSEEANQVFYFIFPAILIAIYSIFLGKFNSVSLSNQKSLLDLYYLLCKGIYHEFIRNAGLMILLISVIMQALFLFFAKQRTLFFQILPIYFWLISFAILYVFLLPFGGYREYRPEILRYDTLLPIILALIFLFVYTLVKVFENDKSLRISFGVLTSLLFAILMIRDKPGFTNNETEKMALIKIANSNDKTVYLDKEISVISWGPLTDPNKSIIIGEMLYKYNITSERKLFYYSERVAAK